MELARKSKKQVRSISLGQGQEPAARKLIATGVSQGSWVMLQNCHLGLRFMGEIEQTMIKLEEIHHEFQLWVTSESHPKFPIGLLQVRASRKHGWNQPAAAMPHPRRPL